MLDFSIAAPGDDPIGTREGDEVIFGTAGDDRIDAVGRGRPDRRHQTVRGSRWPA
jgi:hypothetical protein